MASKSKVLLIALIVTLGGLLFGHNTAVVNGSLSFLVDSWNINSWMQGLISSALELSAAIGALFGGGISDKIGRKKTLRIISWIFLIGAVGCALAPSAWFLVGARFFLGLAVGSASAIVPIYLAEISTSAHRGRVVSINQVMIVSGQFLAFLLNWLLGRMFISADGVIEYSDAWRLMMGVAIFPALVMIIGMTKVFESPKWLVKQGKLQKAVEVIKSIYSQDEDRKAQIAELHELQMNQQQGKEVKTRSKIPAWAIRVAFIGCLLGIIQQFVGINAMMYYSTNIMETFGFSKQSALMFNVLNGVICVGAAMIGMIVVDKMGRKKLDSIGLSVCAASLVLVGILSNLLAGMSFTPYLLLALIFVYIFAFQGAVGPCTWLLISEIFPAKHRGTFMGIATFVLWTANFLVGFLFPPMLEAIGINAIFYIFAGCAVAGLIIVNTLLPETKGKTLDEIESFFSGETKQDETVAKVTTI
ncbi:sugar porter family MFS transporter [Paenibacillus azoreducens]|uniref:MFS transporter n=1 Tax=Paenibacillus azoreducens TaxID=116718 RepID=A0A919Y6K4_9BACL|nr:sugar porter family MFS transporter [Paenibacillus azoreducens]GIO45602.1 MFS transporter [Paenibacillus azoreducens]